VYEQYDSMVGVANRTTNRPSDAAIVRIRGTEQSIVITVDCNSRYVHADPEQGCAIAVAEAARNITCSGGEPVAITNCLNFGNPYVPEVYWQFVGAIMGMKKSCEKFGTPVTGGNVSFYNQSSDEGPVFPDADHRHAGPDGQAGNADDAGLQERRRPDLPGGPVAQRPQQFEYLYSYRKVKGSPAPYFDLDEEYEVQQAVKTLIRERLVESAHDVADGGLFRDAGRIGHAPRAWASTSTPTGAYGSMPSCSGKARAGW
jgi:phosphoribosylformylglycinamidine synthase